MATLPGIAPMNLRLPGEPDPMLPDATDIIVEMAEDGGDMPIMDEHGNVLEIEHGDGSISISLDGNNI